MFVNPVQIFMYHVPNRTEFKIAIVSDQRVMPQLFESFECSCLVISSAKNA